MLERVQKIIATTGFCSRRKAEELIKKQLVKVNDKIIEIGTKADPEKDTISVNNNTINTIKKFYYYVLNKPKGILVTKEDSEGRRVIYDLNSMLDLRDEINTELNYVGRLDGMSEGVLILTNDGDFNNLLTHPKHHAEKTYLIRTEPKISDEDCSKIEKGIMIDERIAFARISEKKENQFHMTIKEGRNRIIRRILEEKLNYKIYLLKRVEMAGIKLGNLETGQLKKIDEKTILKIKDKLLNKQSSLRVANSNTTERCITPPSETTLSSLQTEILPLQSNRLLNSVCNKKENIIRKTSSYKETNNIFGGKSKKTKNNDKFNKNKFYINKKDEIKKNKFINKNKEKKKKNNKKNSSNENIIKSVKKDIKNKSNIKNKKQEEKLKATNNNKKESNNKSKSSTSNSKIKDKKTKTPFYIKAISNSKRNRRK
jgi:23S rRNA pseudouridine2605 synthase